MLRSMHSIAEGLKKGTIFQMRGMSSGWNFIIMKMVSGCNYYNVSNYFFFSLQVIVMDLE